MITEKTVGCWPYPPWSLVTSPMSSIFPAKTWTQSPEFLSTMQKKTFSSCFSHHFLGFLLENMLTPILTPMEWSTGHFPIWPVPQCLRQVRQGWAQELHVLLKECLLGGGCPRGHDGNKYDYINGVCVCVGGYVYIYIYVYVCDN